MASNTVVSVIIIFFLGLLMIGGVLLYNRYYPDETDSSDTDPWKHESGFSYPKGMTSNKLVKGNFTRSQCQTKAAADTGSNAYAYADNLNDKGTNGGDCRLMKATSVELSDRHKPWKAGFNATMKLDMADGKTV
jgi:hypothetical protein